MPFPTLQVLREWRRRGERRLRAAWASAPEGPPPPQLTVHRLESLAAYQAHVANAVGDSWDLEHRLAEANPDKPFVVEGRCWVDSAPVAFEVDYLYGQPYQGRLIPNWRERLVCPICRMNNRQRGCMHVAVEYLGLRPGSRVYMTEQMTQSYAMLRSRYPNVVGSEFLGPGAAPGSVNLAGLRHEDITRLSFPGESFDAILSFDVLEHVPSYRKAFAECLRVLKPGGTMLFSVPFLQDSPQTRTRAHFDASGQLVHGEPPAYHGDPVRPGEGVLCFHDFGWDMLEHAREAGFADVTALTYRDPAYGYLGGWPLLFAATR